MMDDFISLKIEQALEALSVRHPTRVFVGVLGGIALWAVITILRPETPEFPLMLGCLACGPFLALLPLLISGKYTIRERHRELFDTADELIRRGNLPSYEIQQHCRQTLDDLRKEHVKLATSRSEKDVGSGTIETSG